jgi:hypothetical protein
MLAQGRSLQAKTHGLFAAHLTAFSSGRGLQVKPDDKPVADDPRKGDQPPAKEGEKK